METKPVLCVVMPGRKLRCICLLPLRPVISRTKCTQYTSHSPHHTITPFAPCPYAPLLATFCLFWQLQSSCFSVNANCQVGHSSQFTGRQSQVALCVLRGLQHSVSLLSLGSFRILKVSQSESLQKILWLSFPVPLPLCSLEIASLPFVIAQI